MPFQRYDEEDFVKSHEGKWAVGPAYPSRLPNIKLPFYLFSLTERVNSTQLLCNGEKKTITCTREPGLAILSAFYGKRTGKDCRGELGYRDDIPECSNPRAFEHIKKMCENKKSCDISAERDLYGKDECPGVNKYLEVSYAC